MALGITAGVASSVLLLAGLSGTAPAFAACTDAPGNPDSDRDDP
jgi:hypothetical protein